MILMLKKKDKKTFQKESKEKISKKKKYTNICENKPFLPHIN